MLWLHRDNKYYPLGIKVYKDKWGITVQLGFILCFLVIYENGIRYDKHCLIDGVELHILPTYYDKYMVNFKYSYEWFFKVIGMYKVMNNPGVYPCSK